MKIKFCGASTTVTGSCHLITTENHNVLLDCGQFQGGKAMEALNLEAFPFNPSEIEALILSHAHIDHCGRIPLLVKRGFKGKIYCTDATADLLEVMLRDSAHIHEQDAIWQSKRNLRAGKKAVEPLYTMEDAEKALTQVMPVLYDQLITLNDDMKFCLNDAGHILGSAITELWVTEEGNTSKIVFSGDLGVMDRPILRDPTIIKKADHLIMETTYGNRLHGKNSTSIDGLLEAVVKTIKRGGTVIIPSFAVGRTQELIYEFNNIYERNQEYHDILGSIKVYIDSPMATTTTEVFRRNAQVFDEEAKEYILSGDNPLDFPNLEFTRTTAASQALNNDSSPKIIISASGMCEAGRIRHHLKHNLWDGKNTVIFVGYQAEGTLGRLIVDGQKEVTLFGEQVHVNAEIVNLDGFSGHADRDGLVSWLKGFEKEPNNIFLVHGEMDAKRDFAKYVNENLGYKPIVVEGNSEFDLKNDKLTNYDEAIAEAYDDKKIQDLRNRIANIHTNIEKILDSTDIAMGMDMSRDKIDKIRNTIIQLEKDTINLGEQVTEEDRVQ
ncbi:MAG: MBL fold metallo-hydrolase [Clostridia bacterium]|nr:MBL fold metallo-hydrolase [Clostridia bacterium]